MGQETSSRHTDKGDALCIPLLKCYVKIFSQNGQNPFIAKKKRMFMAKFVEIL